MTREWHKNLLIQFVDSIMSYMRLNKYFWHFCTINIVILRYVETKIENNIHVSDAEDAIFKITVSCHSTYNYSYNFLRF